jgi:hypothetical protein
MLNFDDFGNETEEIGISKIIFNSKEECFLGSAKFLVAKKLGGGNNGKLLCTIGS